MSAFSSIIKDISQILSAKIVVLFLSALSIFFLARALGAEGRGTLAAVMVFPLLLVTISEGGMRQAAVHYIGGKLADEGAVVGALFTYIGVAGILGFGATYVALRYITPLDLGLSTVIAASLIVPATLTVNALQGYFLGKREVSRFSHMLWIQKVVYLTCIAMLFVIGGLSVLSAVICLAFAAVFNVAQVCWHLFPHLKTRLTFDCALLIRMLCIGWKYSLALFLLQANYKIDVFLLAVMANASTLGNYAIAVQVGELLWQLPGAVLLVIMSRSATDSGSGLVVDVARTVRLTLVITAFMAVGVVIVSFTWLELLLGREFASASQMILLLAPGLVVATIFKTVSSYYAGKGRPLITVGIMGVAVLVNTILNVILIPGFGGNGAAMASTVSYFVAAVAFLFFFCSREKMRVRDVLLINAQDFAGAAALFDKISKHLMGKRGG